MIDQVRAWLWRHGWRGGGTETQLRLPDGHVVHPSEDGVRIDIPKLDRDARRRLKRERQAALHNISGIAILPTAETNGDRTALMVDDERWSMWAGVLHADRTLDVHGSVEIKRNGMAKGEVDLEAVATDGAWFFAIGSHGVGRRTGRYSPARNGVFSIGPTPGPPVDQGDLGPALAAHPVLRNHYRPTAPDPEHAYLQNNGVNIEGLAVTAKDLLVGFRGPVTDEGALLLQVNRAAVFGNAPVASRLHRLPLGRGRGIRAMAGARGGFMIVAGNSGVSSLKLKKRRLRSPKAHRGNPFALYFWRHRPDGDNDGASGAAPADPVLLATLENPPPASRKSDDGAAKVEAVEVIEETDGTWRVLLLFDGIKGGGALTFDLPKPPALR